MELTGGEWRAKVVDGEGKEKGGGEEAVPGIVIDHVYFWLYD